MVEMIVREMGPLNGKTLGVLGLAFKNNTDDMKGAPSLSILSELASLGANFRVYDPKAMQNADKLFKSRNVSAVKYCINEYDASLEVDALILMTEWNQFRSLNLETIRNAMSGNYFFDLRNIYVKESMIQKGFQYYSVGRG